MKTRNSLRPLSNSDSIPKVATKRATIKLSSKRITDITTSESFVEKPKTLTSVLHGGQVDELIGRDAEISQIRKLLNKSIENSKNLSVYISGAPGTGKTACVLQETNRFTDENNASLLFINCMQLDSPSNVYKLIAEKLNINIPSSAKSLDSKLVYLENAINNTPTSKPVVIVLDEIDQLATRQQQILYTIFDWPRKLKTRIIIFGIANALDLTERLLPKLSLNEYRPIHLAFAPYTREEIGKIVIDRLKSLTNEGIKMEPMAIQFCARKVSSSSGDVRKALAICRRAVELAKLDVRVLLTDKENNLSSNVIAVPTIKHVNAAIKESEMSAEQIVTGAVPKRPSIRPILASSDSECPSTPSNQGLPTHHKIALACCLLLRQQRKVREFPLGLLHDMYNKVCEIRNLSACDMSEFTSICELLDSHGLVRVIVPGPKSMLLSTPSRMKKVSLSLDDKGLERALNDQALLTAILETKL